MKKYKQLTLSLRYQIFADHEKTTDKLNLKFYLCDPYSSWQGELNEHTNSLIREYIPKKSSFKDID